MKVKRILLMCVFAIVIVLTFAACDDKTPADKPSPEHEHTIVIDDAVPTTCKNSGLTSGAHCSECGEILVEQEKIDKLEHTVVVDAAVEATCVKSGLTAGEHCSECGEIIVAQKIIPTNPHNFEDRVCKDCAAIDYSTGLAYAPNGNGTCVIIGIGSCTDTEIYIPPYIGAYKVTSIRVSAFSDCSSITSVKLPDSVTSIGNSAFRGCSSLTSIVIPDSVTSIDHWAFSGCSSLTSVKLPDSITSIGYSAFRDCSSLTSIVIPDSVTSIGDSAFSGCSSLTSVKLPDRVTSIGDYAFSGCSSLTSITIPDSVTSIGDWAFGGCSSLVYNEYDNAYYLGNDSNPYLVLMKAKDIYITSCTIHSNTRFIHSYAFSDCSSLTSIVIPDSVTSIGSLAFQACGFSNIVIPDSVTSIESGAFNACRSLTSIVIPDSVTSISYGVFAWCSNLESITVEEGNDVYHSAGNCLIETASKTLIAVCKNSVIPTDGSVTRIGEDAFSGCSSLTSIVIPDSVTSIGSYAFSGCYNLTSIVIPDSVTSIGVGAFSSCTSLESITVEKGNAVYHSAGNCLIETATKTLIAGCKNSVIPIDGNVTSIGDCAFDCCWDLTYIEIPNSIISIGDLAFQGCSFSSIVIPDSVTSIGYDVFNGCSSLTSITFTGTVQQWNNVVKDNFWNGGLLATEVICSDGTVKLN